MKPWPKAWIDFDCFFQFHFHFRFQTPFASLNKIFPVWFVFHFFCNFSFDLVVFLCFVWFCYAWYSCVDWNTAHISNGNKIALYRRIRNQARKDSKLNWLQFFSFRFHLLPLTVLFSHVWIWIWRVELPICIKFWKLKVNQAISFYFLHSIFYFPLRDWWLLCTIVQLHTAQYHKMERHTKPKLKWNVTTKKGNWIGM